MASTVISDSCDLPPPILYKYRPLDRPQLEWIADIVLRSTIWCGSPLSFNDPFDCFPAIDTSGNQHEKVAWAKRYAMRHEVGRNRAERRAFISDVANRKLKRGLGSTASNDGGRDAWRRTVAKMGVVSLTARPDNMLMWGHYADSHTGVCLEFATYEPPFALAHAVQYTSERPVFRPLQRNRADLMENTLLRKAKFWSYEEEWRVFGKGIVGKLDFPSVALTGIILGAAISVEDEAAIRMMLARRSSSIAIMRAVINRRHYQLDIEPA